MHRQLLKWIRAAAARHRVRWIPQPVRRLVRAGTRALHRLYHLRVRRGAIAGRYAGFDDVAGFLRDQYVPLQAPMVLISQVQRSGGTLLSQLFDGHPALAAHPHELKIGFPEADRWPLLDPARGPRWNFGRLFDMNFPRLVRRGFTKGDRDPQRYSFLLIPRLQYLLFQHLFETKPPAGPRAILDHFFTAFFNAWLNYQGDLAQKRWITAFAPRLANEEENMQRFFDAYPDGRLIQIVRDPRSWYPSARNHLKSGFDNKTNEHVLGRWCVSAESMLRNKARYGNRVIILRFEDLVGRTEMTMRALARELGIAMHPLLLEPTFNGHVMRANSSFDVAQRGVIAAPLARQEMLEENERRLIAERCGALYHRVLAEAIVVAAEAPRMAAASS